MLRKDLKTLVRKNLEKLKESAIEQKFEDLFGENRTQQHSWPESGDK